MSDFLFDKFCTVSPMTEALGRQWLWSVWTMSHWTIIAAAIEIVPLR